MPPASDRPAQPIDPATHDQRPIEREELVIPLHAEEAAFSVRPTETGVVRVATVTRERDHLVNETLSRETVEIEHVPVGRYVDAVPQIREEGDVTIVPVVDEVIIVERKLRLREEVHIRRVRTTEQHTETVRLREQEAVIERRPANEPAPATPAHPTPSATLQPTPGATLPPATTTEKNS